MARTLVPAQASVAFDRAGRSALGQWQDRQSGRKVRAKLGRPRTVGGTGKVGHQTRAVLASRSAVHVTVRTRKGVPSLRSRRRFAAIKRAFVKFCAVEGSGFRLVHFAVLSNHVHFIVEADSAAALSMGMQRVLHSISRRLNALSVADLGGHIQTHIGGYKSLPGWLGRG